MSHNNNKNNNSGNLAADYKPSHKLRHKSADTIVSQSGDKGYGESYIISFSNPLKINEDLSKSFTNNNSQSRDDLPREKLLRNGASQLTDEELLAIFLRVGYKGKGVMELSSELIHNKGLSWLLEADKKDFCSYKGLGRTKYVQLQAGLELAKRYLEDVLKRDTIAMDSPAKMMDFLRHKLGANKREVFACVSLDAKSRVIDYSELFQGSITSAPVYIRPVIAHAIKTNACALVVSHNHPSGSAKPSASDKKITKELKLACDLMEIILLDHIIVSGSECFSFRKERLL